jgi:hypothetical protein
MPFESVYNLNRNVISWRIDDKKIRRLTIDGKLTLHGIGTHFLSPEFLSIVIDVLQIILLKY